MQDQAESGADIQDRCGGHVHTWRLSGCVSHLLTLYRGVRDCVYIYIYGLACMIISVDQLRSGGSSKGQSLLPSRGLPLLLARYGCIKALSLRLLFNFDRRSNSAILLLVHSFFLENTDDARPHKSRLDSRYMLPHKMEKINLHSTNMSIYI